MEADRSLLDRVALIQDVEDLLGRKVDVATGCLARSHFERGSAVVTDDRVYLGDILERIERIEAYTQGGREAFLRLL